MRTKVEILREELKKKYPSVIEHLEEGYEALDYSNFYLPDLKALQACMDAGFSAIETRVIMSLIAIPQPKYFACQLRERHRDKFHKMQSMWKIKIEEVSLYEIAAIEEFFRTTEDMYLLDQFTLPILVKNHYGRDAYKNLGPEYFRHLNLRIIQSRRWIIINLPDLSKARIIKLKKRGINPYTIKPILLKTLAHATTLLFDTDELITVLKIVEEAYKEAEKYLDM